MYISQKADVKEIKILFIQKKKPNKKNQFFHLKTQGPIVKILKPT